MKERVKNNKIKSANYYYFYIRVGDVRGSKLTYSEQL